MAIVTGLLFSLTLFFITWLISVKQKDASFVDRVWGLAYVSNVFGYVILSGTDLSFSQALVIILVVIWGSRLSIHIYLRNRGHGEDYRYQNIRAGYQSGFWWKSLFTIFLLQWFLAAIISIPLFYVLKFPRELTPAMVGLGLFCWIIGFFFEAVGDWQLVQFKRNPENRGKLLRTGLWKLTRHPNYFGDGMVWWGYYLFAWGAGGWWTIISPIIMTIFLRKISGVDLLESKLKSSKLGYEDYIESTPAFVPRIWPKKKNDSSS